MPSISRTARKLKKAREIRTQKLKAQKLEAKKNNKKRQINEIVDGMGEPMLDNTLELITRSNITKERYALYTTIDQLSETEVKPAQHLLNKMRYPKGSQKGQILSPYLQDKALLFIEDSLYKPANKL